MRITHPEVLAPRQQYSIAQVTEAVHHILEATIPPPFVHHRPASPTFSSPASAAIATPSPVKSELAEVTEALKAMTSAFAQFQCAQLSAAPQPHRPAAALSTAAPSTPYWTPSYLATDVLPNSVHTLSSGLAPAFDIDELIDSKRREFYALEQQRAQRQHASRTQETTNIPRPPAKTTPPSLDRPRIWLPSVTVQPPPLQESGSSSIKASAVGPLPPPRSPEAAKHLRYHTSNVVDAPPPLHHLATRPSPPFASARPERSISTHANVCTLQNTENVFAQAPEVRQTPREAASSHRTAAQLETVSTPEVPTYKPIRHSSDIPADLNNAPSLRPVEVYFASMPTSSVQPAPSSPTCNTSCNPYIVDGAESSRPPPVAEAPERPNDDKRDPTDAAAYPHRPETREFTTPLDRPPPALDSDSEAAPTHDITTPSLSLPCSPDAPDDADEAQSSNPASTTLASMPTSCSGATLLLPQTRTARLALARLWRRYQSWGDSTTLGYDDFGIPWQRQGRRAFLRRRRRRRPPGVASTRRGVTRVGRQVEHSDSSGEEVQWLWYASTSVSRPVLPPYHHVPRARPPASSPSFPCDTANSSSLSAVTKTRTEDGPDLSGEEMMGSSRRCACMPTPTRSPSSVSPATSAKVPDETLDNSRTLVDDPHGHESRSEVDSEKLEASA